MLGQHKIIFTGPVGAGKTTAITAISDFAPISTEQVATDEAKNKKELTTVAMDYGSMQLDNSEKLHIYGTPGQQRFSFMWDLLIEGAVGIVILVDDANPSPLEDLRTFISAFQKFILQHAVVVGVTRMDMGGGIGLENYHAVLAEFDLNVPLFEVDARQRDDVIMLVQALLYSADPALIGMTA